jgi:hypothetical protein
MFEITKKSVKDIDLEIALFVVKARIEDKTKPEMRVVHVERTRSGSRLVCTDGRRLHIAEISMRIDEGEYEPVITKSSIILRGPLTDHTFPNWRRIMPPKSIDKGTVNLDKASLGKNTGMSGSLSLVYSQILEKTGEVMNIRYLDDLQKKEWTVLTQKEKLRPIVFQRNEGGKEIVAVIMPINAAA